MTPESANRIRQSFSLLAPQLEQVACDAYARLFRVRPDVRPLFPRDVKLQEQHLAAALALIVRNLLMLDAMEGSFQQLGADHARAGVRPEHYPLMRDAILESMSAALTENSAWRPDLADDWRSLLDQIAIYMLQGGLAVTANGLGVRH